MDFPSPYSLRARELQLIRKICDTFFLYEKWSLRKLKKLYGRCWKPIVRIHG
jgi:hypothetical protein